MRLLLGIDIGGTNIKIALIDKKGRIKAKKTFPTADFKGNRALIERITGETKKLLAEYGVVKKDIIGVGVGAPGAVDIRSGTVHYLTNVPEAPTPTPIISFL